MSFPAPSLSPSSQPLDLGAGSRVGLSVLVVAAHVAVALAVWKQVPDHAEVGESAPIVVSLIPTQSPSPASVTPPREAPPEPVRPTPVTPPPRPQKTTPPAPQPATPQAAAPVAATTPMLSSRNGAEAAVAPLAAPAPAVTSPAAPTAPAVVAAPAPPPPPAAPREFHISAVSYLVPPVLTYPRISRELGESGTVLLRVLVDEQGQPREIQVARSSGHPRLDQQAVQAMKAARFKPHIEGGVTRSMWVRTPQTFLLEDN